MNALSRIPLVAILAVTATLELLLNRIGVHLVGSSTKDRTLIAVVDIGGLFTLYLTGILALIIFTWAVVVMIRDRELFRTPDRIALTILAATFLPMAAMGQLVELPVPVVPLLNISFGLLLLGLIWSFMRRPAPLRSRLGVLYLCAPILLHVFWLASRQVPTLVPADYSDAMVRVYESAEHLVVVGAFAAFLFFAPFPRLSNLLEPLPMIAATLLTAGVALLAKYQYIETAQAAYNGLRINLPAPSAHGVMHLAALFFFILTLGTLTIRSAPQRSTALGLYLIAVSGFHLQEPYQLLLTLIGMAQITRGAMEAQRLVSQRSEAVAAPSPEGWSAYLSRLAAACSRPKGNGEAVQLQGNGQQIAYIRGKQEGLPFTLRILHDRGEIQRLEAVIGKPPRDAAQLSLNRRRGSRGGRVSERSCGSRIKLDDEDFDRQFTLQDNTDRAPSLLSAPGVLEELERLIHGWLGIWPGEGLRYLAKPGPDGWPLPLAEVVFSPEDASTEDVEDLVALLTSLAREAGVVG